MLFRKQELILAPALRAMQFHLRCRRCTQMSFTNGGRLDYLSALHNKYCHYT